tara:strand:+ start:1631 stop:2164 length:534 start_codon:yes stop_codon:yes gene_type:complete
MIHNRVCSQTNEEWLQEYETGVVTPIKEKQKPVNVLELVFDHHRTARTKSGSVILCFVEVATGEEYVAFFNADLNQQRGSRKGEPKKIGVGGQFLPPNRGKFRKWWVRTVGAKPKRWSTVHKELKPRLKGLKFTGDTDISYKKNGQPFNRVKNLRTLKLQVRNNLGTSEEQFCDIPF